MKQEVNRTVRKRNVLRGGISTPSVHRDMSVNQNARFASLLRANAEAAQQVWDCDEHIPDPPLLTATAHS